VPTTIAFLWMLNPTFGVAHVFRRWLPWGRQPQVANSEKSRSRVIVITGLEGLPFLRAREVSLGNADLTTERPQRGAPSTALALGSASARHDPGFTQPRDL